MNTNILKELVDRIIRLDALFSVEEIFGAFVLSFENLISNPADATLQQEYKKKLGELRAAIRALAGRIESRLMDTIESIGGGRWFSPNLIVELDDIIRNNSVTTSIAVEEIREVAQQRSEYMKTLDSLTLSMKALGIDAYSVSLELPEIGFEIPRSIFDDKLNGFQKELRQLYVIVKTFQKLADEATDPIKVRTLSTTDPLILLGIGYLTLREIGRGVTWVLNTIDTVNNIKSAREQTANTGISEEDVDKFFAPRIDQAVAAAVKEKKIEILGAPNAKKHKELGAEIELALKMLLSRVERGMKVELRFLVPPAAPEGDEEVDEYAELRLVAEELRVIQSEIKFKELQHVPVLSLEFSPEDENMSDKK